MSEKIEIKKSDIDESWYTVLQEEFEADYFKQIKAHLLAEKQEGHEIYPSAKDIFAAFNHTPFHKVKVVILGQDPYHGPGQANGLCFSVSDGIPKPPSLQNIFKEIKAELGLEIPITGNLECWAKQGIFMLNAMLTVRARQAASHQKFGWQHFTDAAIKALSDHREGIVFLLWGKFAQGKAKLIDEEKHKILQSPHPSPFSAYSGFFGNGHFAKTNELLVALNLEPIDWHVS